ncbi:MAG: NAD(P)-binding protein [Planctomycetes bacterium]|nr:NAD(P)-binding protein [Planctomycetota bacterium]
MNEARDAIVIGTGHNGLTCACYLARAGLRTLVLDQYHTVGGMATTEEITLPGFRSDMYAFGFQFANLSPVPQELGNRFLRVLGPAARSRAGVVSKGKGAGLMNAPWMI